MLYRYRAGIPWRDLPERFSDFLVVHLRHIRWSQRGVWQCVFEALNAGADNEYAMIDAIQVALGGTGWPINSRFGQKTGENTGNENKPGESTWSSYNALRFA